MGKLEQDTNKKGAKLDRFCQSPGCSDVKWEKLYAFMLIHRPVFCQRVTAGNIIMQMSPVHINKALCMLLANGANGCVVVLYIIHKHPKMYLTRSQCKYFMSWVPVNT